MPFQVSFSAKSTPKGLIDFFTAGPDQIVVCDTTVFMEATVVGDFTGHTFLWEQTDGDPVTWNTPLNQFAVNYTTANFQDKTFRFYIDKGTGNEQYDEIIMFSTPTFPYYGGVPDQNCLVNFGGSLRCDRPSLSIAVELPTAYHTEILIECGTIDNPVLLWTAPCTADKLIQYVVQQRIIAGPWTDEAIIPPGTLQHVPLVVGATYRVVAVVQEDNSAVSVAYSNTLYQTGLFGNTPATIGSGAVLTQSMQVQTTPHTGLKTIKVPSYELFLLTLLNCDPDDFEDLQLPNNDIAKHVSMPAYEVFLLTKIDCAPDVPEDQYIPNNATPKHVRVPAFTVLDLEGGDIGG